jgi:hypothetical protein
MKPPPLDADDPDDPDDPEDPEDADDPDDPDDPEEFPPPPDDALASEPVTAASGVEPAPESPPQALHRIGANMPKGSAINNFARTILFSSSDEELHSG